MLILLCFFDCCFDWVWTDSLCLLYVFLKFILLLWICLVLLGLGWCFGCDFSGVLGCFGVGFSCVNFGVFRVFSVEFRG